MVTLVLYALPLGGSSETPWRIPDSSVKVGGMVVQKYGGVKAGPGGVPDVVEWKFTGWEKAGGSVDRESRRWESPVSIR